VLLGGDAAKALQHAIDAIVGTWPVQAAVAVVGPSGTLATSSGSDVVRRFASVTKQSQRLWGQPLPVLKN
jgi:hypothetical protein